MRQQTRPEVGEGLYNAAIVNDSCLIVTYPIKQQGTIVKSLQVIGFIAQHEVEVFDGMVIVAQLQS